MKSLQPASTRLLLVVFLLASGTLPVAAGSARVSGPDSVDGAYTQLLPLVGANHHHSAAVLFDHFPDGTPVSEDTILAGDEFLARDIRLAGAPQSSYCEGATAAAILVPPHHIGDVDFAFLTASEPDELGCHGVPVEIRFVVPVHEVALVFAGATDTYVMQVYDTFGCPLATRYKDAVWGGGTLEVRWASGGTNIASVVFGRETSTTIVKELRYTR